MSEGGIVLSGVSKTVQSGAERLTILRELDLTIPGGQLVQGLVNRRQNEIKLWNGQV